MSEIQSSSSRPNKGGQRSKKLSTRVDLTPMVDLGFLLITFFIFTTTMTESKAMRVIVPSDKQDAEPPETAHSKTISLVLGEQNRIYYYHGMDTKSITGTDYSASGIRSVLQQKIKTVDAMYGKTGETTVLIKPTQQASYRNIVGILDELLINGVKKYVLLEASAEENSLLPRY
jgi:biopolymer transport protein ExbD